MSMMWGLKAIGFWDEAMGVNVLDSGAPFYDTYETSDGRFVAVGAIEPQFYALLLERLGIDPAALGPQLDAARWPEAKRRFAEAFKAKSRDAWAEIFSDSDACVTPVLSPWEAHHHPHSATRNAFLEVAGLMQPAPAPRFSRSRPDDPHPMDAGGRRVTSTLVYWVLAPAELNTVRAPRAQH